MNSDSDLTTAIIAMERAALDRWGRGDPSGFLEISDPDVVYFDPYLERRINGIDELTAWYEKLRGKIRLDRYELIQPRVQASGDMAVLTFNFISWTGKQEHCWNCTEVYRRRDNQWRIIQTHWSFNNPPKN